MIIVALRRKCIATYVQTKWSDGVKTHYDKDVHHILHWDLTTESQKIDMYISLSQILEPKNQKPREKSLENIVDSITLYNLRGAIGSLSYWTFKLISVWTRGLWQHFLPLRTGAATHLRRNSVKDKTHKTDANFNYRPGARAIPSFTITLPSTTLAAPAQPASNIAHKSAKFNAMTVFSNRHGHPALSKEDQKKRHINEIINNSEI